MLNEAWSATKTAKWWRTSDEWSKKERTFISHQRNFHLAVRSLNSTTRSLGTQTLAMNRRLTQSSEDDDDLFGEDI